MADINNDGIKEIVYVDSNKITAYKSDGTVLNGWPQTLTRAPLISSPSIGDLDKDGRLEVIIATAGYYFISTGEFGKSTIYVFEPDGTIRNGWPKEVTAAYGIIHSPALGDIDNDNELEIVVSTLFPYEEGQVYIFNDDGTMLPGWPIRLNNLIRGTPNIVDIDNDNINEIIMPLGGFASVTPSYLTILSGDGRILNYFGPIYQSTSTSPFTGDIDQDKKLELVYQTNTIVYIFDLPSANLKVEWSQYRNDEKHTGLYVKPQLHSVSCNDNSIIGDANGDGTITQNDVSLITDIILEKEAMPYNKCCVDVNRDGSVDILDAQSVISYITTGSGRNAGKRCSEVTTPQTCSDGTLYSQRSLTKPRYCENGNLIDKCSICGCPDGEECQSDGSCKVVVSCLRGDLNNDGAIDALDRQILVNIALEKEQPPEKLCCADLNNDGAINVIDITLLDRIILELQPNLGTC